MLASVGAQTVAAIVPETGMYWSPDRQGVGVYVEHQGGVVSVVAYAFDPFTGAPKFYVGAAELRDDGVTPDGGLSPPFNTEGFYPLHWAPIELFEFSGGPCLNCNEVPSYEGQSAGFGSFYFPDLSEVWVSDLFLMGFGIGRSPIILERFNFLNERISNGRGGLVLHDLAGEWVFVDTRDASAPPGRYRFAFREQIDDGEEPDDIFPFTRIYEDSARGAELICRFAYREVVPGDGVKASGCELLAGGEVLMHFKAEDIGLYRIQAAPGELPFAITPNDFRGPYRQPGEIIGLRVETVPEGLDGDPEDKAVDSR